MPQTTAFRSTIETKTPSIYFIIANKDLILHILLLGMAYQVGCSTQWLYQVHLSLYVHVHVQEMFMYSVSHSV